MHRFIDLTLHPDGKHQTYILQPSAGDKLTLQSVFSRFCSRTFGVYYVKGMVNFKQCNRAF